MINHADIDRRKELLTQIAEAAKGTEYDKMVQLDDIFEGRPVTRLVHRYEIGFGCRPINEKHFQSYARRLYEGRKIIQEAEKST